MENMREIQVKIFRFNSRQANTEGRYDSYVVPIVEQGTTVMNVLHYISEHCDSSVAYYSSCRRGVCAGCAVRVNGKPRLACSEIVSGDLVLEPIKKDKIIKDLLCQNRIPKGLFVNTTRKKRE